MAREAKNDDFAEGTTLMSKRITGDCAVHAAENDRCAVGVRLEETKPAPCPLFGLSTLPVSETKSDLLQLIERAQLEILYRHPR